MTEPMIERVARSMAMDAGYDWASMFERYSVKWETEAVRPWWRDRARAAIEEMRNPTRGMLCAATKAMLPKYRPTPDHVPCKEKHRIRYRAMIDAALSEDSQ